MSFVTFNYDRFLEQWLLTKLQHSFGIDHSAALSFMEQIPIHHVYGSLGSIDASPEDRADAWMSASQGIRTIFDAERFDNEIAESKKLLRNAQVVCLLGYGFHRENTELLTLIDCLGRADCQVTSSRFEMMEFEWKRLTAPFAEAGITIEAAMYPLKCRGALRHLPVFMK